MDFFNKLFKNSKFKRLFALLVILAAIPVALALVRVSQDIRERAAGGPTSLSILPISQTKSIGESGQLSVYVDPGGANVSSLEIVLDYDPSIVSVIDINPGPFFTDPAAQIGDPLVITKDLATPGRVHYALGFPLGSGYSSTNTTDAIIIDFNTVGGGTTSFDFVTSGQPSTLVADIGAQNVLGQTNGGTIDVSSAGARLYFSSPVPANPQSEGGTFTLDILADTGGQQIDAIDARISFDESILELLSLDQGTEAAFTSYPALDFDNSSGTAVISANVGSDSSSNPAVGSALHVGTLTFRADLVTFTSQVSYDFTRGDRNDSNMVLSGTWQTQDPVDILASVGSADILIISGPTTTPTLTSTPTPTISPTPTPAGLPVVNFNDYSITSFGSGQDFNPTMNILDGGITLQLIGNGWKKIPYPYTVTANTILEFDFKSDTEAEVQGIALEEDNVLSANRVFKVHGTQPYGIATYDNYVKGSGWKSYSIPVGQHYTGNMSYLVFANDHDFGGQDGESLFRNVRVCETICSLDSTPTPSPTSTPGSPQTLTVRLSFEGRLRSGVSKRKIIGFFYRKAGETAVSTAIFTTNENGEGTVDLAPGSYVLLLDADGYLARRFGSDASPVVIPESNIILDLSASPLFGGDFNDDGEVNEVDYTQFFLPFFLGSTEFIDLDGSGEINNLDFAIMRANWNLIDDSL